MFKVIKEDKVTKARVGIFETAHGSLETPSFFPVATQAAAKGIWPKELEEIGIDGLLVNAYHLYLRPGVKVIKACGGLHKFMNFHKTIITDSGGYQIFSLERLRKVSDEGVQFQSHVDGTSFFLTPQDVIETQLILASDVVVPLDECVKFPTEYKQADIAASRTISWLKKSKEYFDIHKKNNALFFGIVQGSTYLDLREKCLTELLKSGVDGLCMGGLSVGEPEDLRYNVLSFIAENTDNRHIRYFMGYGLPPDILEAVTFGIDLFDCVVPTRMARTGTAFTNRGKIVVRNSPYISDTTALDEQCRCQVCKNFSRAYIRHLINVNEMLGAQLLAYHNLFWYRNFMENIKTAIKEDRFVQFKKDFLSKFTEQ
ncbi:MAG: tRNA guanosine(34) transglycosylase Tgt [Candidatus Omnitrophota bacterium]